MRTAWILLSTVCLLSAGSGLAVGLAQEPDEAGREPTLEERVDRVFSDIDTPHGPGCALSVMRDGAIVYRRGYGMANLEYGVPITPSSVFHIASTSKQFTAMAVALLARDGEVSWDDDIRDHVPEVPDLGHRITLRHLVHHTSGLRDQWELLIMAGWRWEADLVTQADVLDVVSRQRSLNFAPGTQMLYSNTGFTLLAAVVERVSGQSLREFARERIFDPLGMDSTHFHDDHQRIVPNRAYGYAPVDGSDGLRISIPDFAIVGATSLFTTVEDLARWDRNFYTGTVGGRELLDELLKGGELADGEELDFAKGLIHGTHRGLPTVSHGGADAGYRAQLLRFPGRRFSVAVLCNTPSGAPSERARRVADLYLEDAFPEPAVTGDAPDESPTTPDSDAASPADGEDEGTASEGSEDGPPEARVAGLEGLAGYYLQPVSDIGLRVVASDRGLRLGGEEGPLLIAAMADAPGRRRFKVADDPEATVTFEIAAPPSAGTPAADPPVGTAPLREADRSTTGVRLLDAPGLPGRGLAAARALPPADPAEFAELVGEYRSDELGARYRVELVDGQPHLWNRKHGRLRLTPIYRDGFTFYFDFLAVAFTRDPAGQVDGMTMSGPRTWNVRFERLEDS